MAENKKPESIDPKAVDALNDFLESEGLLGILGEVTSEYEPTKGLSNEEKRVYWFKHYFESSKFWLESGQCLPGKYPIKSCTFLGKTTVDKVQIAKEALQSLGFTEYDGKEGDFVFVDAEDQIKRSCVKLIKVLKKYKNLDFIILNNCEKLLGDYSTAMTIKHISADAEYYGNFHNAPLGECETLPRIVLLGDTDTTGKLYEEHNVIWSGLTNMV